MNCASVSTVVVGVTQSKLVPSKESTSPGFPVSPSESSRVVEIVVVASSVVPVAVRSDVVTELAVKTSATVVPRSVMLDKASIITESTPPPSVDAIVFVDEENVRSVLNSSVEEAPPAKPARLIVVVAPSSSTNNKSVPEAVSEVRVSSDAIFTEEVAPRISVNVSTEPAADIEPPPAPPNSEERSTEFPLSILKILVPELKLNSWSSLSDPPFFAFLNSLLIKSSRRSTSSSERKVVSLTVSITLSVSKIFSTTGLVVRF